MLCSPLTFYSYSKPFHSPPKNTGCVLDYVLRLVSSLVAFLPLNSKSRPRSCFCISVIKILNGARERGLAGKAGRRGESGEKRYEGEEIGGKKRLDAFDLRSSCSVSPCVSVVSTGQSCCNLAERV